MVHHRLVFFLIIFRPLRTVASEIMVLVALKSLAAAIPIPLPSMGINT